MTWVKCQHIISQYNVTYPFQKNPTTVTNSGLNLPPSALKAKTAGQNYLCVDGRSALTLKNSETHPRSRER